MYVIETYLLSHILRDSDRSSLPLDAEQHLVNLKKAGEPYPCLAERNPKWRDDPVT